MYYDRTTVKPVEARWGRWLCVMAVLALLAGPVTAAESDPAATSEAAMDTLAVEPDQAQVTLGVESSSSSSPSRRTRCVDGLRLLGCCAARTLSFGQCQWSPNCPELRWSLNRPGGHAGDKFVPVQEGNLIHIRTKDEHKKTGRSTIITKDRTITVGGSWRPRAAKTNRSMVIYRRRRGWISQRWWRWRQNGRQ